MLDAKLYNGPGGAAAGGAAAAAAPAPADAAAAPPPPNKCRTVAARFSTLPGRVVPHASQCGLWWKFISWHAGQLHSGGSVAVVLAAGPVTARPGGGGWEPEVSPSMNPLPASAPKSIGLPPPGLGRVAAAGSLPLPPPAAPPDSAVCTCVYGEAPLPKSRSSMSKERGAPVNERRPAGAGAGAGPDGEGEIWCGGGATGGADGGSDRMGAALPAAGCQLPPFSDPCIIAGVKAATDGAGPPCWGAPGAASVGVVMLQRQYGHWAAGTPTGMPTVLPHTPQVQRITPAGAAIPWLEGGGGGGGAVGTEAAAVGARRRVCVVVRGGSTVEG